MKTFRNPFSVLRFPFKTLLIVNCQLLIAGALQAQQTNGITISDFSATVGSPSTVTFKVAWNKTVAGRDSAWVFVDYNKEGAMTRLLLESSGHTASAGTITVPNNQGVWLITDTPATGNFSTTVQLRSAATYLAGACVYAVNYFPKGRYTSASTLVFNGTPKYDVTLKHAGGGASSVKKIASPYNVPAGSYVTSLTDATGAPGKCIPMLGDIDFSVSPASPTINRTATFTVNRQPQAPASFAVGYTWAAPGFNNTTGSGATFSAVASNPGTFPVKLTAKAEGHCDTSATRNIEVLNCLPPNTYTLTASASTVCQGAAVTFTLGGSQGSEWKYQLYNGSALVGAVVSGKADHGAITFTATLSSVGGHQYTVHTVNGEGVRCDLPASNPLPVSVTAIPTAPSAPTHGGHKCAGTPITFSASVPGGATGLDWTGSAGVSGTGTSKSTTATTAGKYTAQVRSFLTSGTTCYSGYSAETAATITAIPTAPSAPTHGGHKCAGTPVTFSAGVPGGATGLDWTGSAGVSGTGTSKSTTATTAGKYTAQVRSFLTSGTTCYSGYSAETAATITAIPTAPSAPTHNGPLCSGSALTFSADVPDGATGLDWTGSPGVSGTGTSKSTTATTAGSYTAQVRSFLTSGTTCYSAYTIVVTAFLVDHTSFPPSAPTHNGPKCPGTGITFSSNIPEGATGLDWTGSAGISGTGTSQTTTGTTAGTYTAKVRSYITKNGTTCYSQWSSEVSASIIAPTLTISGGPLNQTVSLGSALTPISYTANSADYISTSPTLWTSACGVDWQYGGTTATIAGTAVACPCSFTFYAKGYVNGSNCNAESNKGTITIVGPIINQYTTGGPSTAKTPKIWRSGTITWSDQIGSADIPDCTQMDKKQFATYMDSGSAGTVTKAYIKINDAMYFSPPCALQYRHVLCPTPWRLPNENDVVNFILYWNRNITITMADRYVNDSGDLARLRYGFYHVPSTTPDKIAYQWYEVGVEHCSHKRGGDTSLRPAGYSVRCVKDN
jgi:hypothetical protein